MPARALSAVRAGFPQLQIHEVEGPFDSGRTLEGEDGGPGWPLGWVDAEGLDLDLIGHAYTYEAEYAWGREIPRTAGVELDVEAMPA